jgi:hypothetical protein
MGWCDPYGEIRLLEEIKAKAQRRKGQKKTKGNTEAQRSQSEMLSFPL